MTSDRIQPICRKYSINIGCFNGKEINPRNITERYISLFIDNNHFCSNWKSQRGSFKKVIENELKPNFKVVDNVISDKHVKSFIKYEYKPKKVQSPLTKIIVYDLETFNKVRTVSYCSCINKLGEISGKNHGNNSEKSIKMSK